MKPTVVILLSDKRSGSTMFRRELCKHPEIRTVDYSPHTYLETHHWLKAAVMLGLDPSKFSGGKIYAGYGARENARTYMEDLVKGNVPEFEMPTDDRELVLKGWEALCEQFAKPVFFEKSPQTLAHWGCLELILEWMKQTDFDVKIIGLVRNPLSVMYSAQELFYTDPEKRQTGWVRIYENLLRLEEKLSREQFALCCYEDIVHDPVQAFSKICKFIGVEECEEVGAGVQSGSMNRWEADQFFTLQLNDEAKAMAQRFGYPDEELSNPDKPTPPLWYRAKRKTERFVKRSLTHLSDRIVVPVCLRKKLRKSK